LLQRRVFGPQSLEFCLQILIAHRAPGVMLNEADARRRNISVYQL
jgi:hypothetical protein